MERGASGIWCQRWNSVGSDGSRGSSGLCEIRLCSRHVPQITLFIFLLRQHRVRPAANRTAVEWDSLAAGLLRSHFRTAVRAWLCAAGKSAGLSSHHHPEEVHFLALSPFPEISRERNRATQGVSLSASTHRCMPFAGGTASHGIGICSTCPPPPTADGRPC